MAHRDTSIEFERIIELTSQAGKISVGELAGVTGIPRNTLLRYLSELIPERIERIGKGRATRYRIATPSSAEAGKTLSNPAADTDSLQLSAASDRLRRKVRLPLHLRPRVGYNREFLESYRPNQTTYLDEATCRELELMGKTPDEGLPAGTYAREILQRLLIDLSFNSSRLEGNTYSLLETERLLNFGQDAEGKNAAEAQMILNHKAAIEMLVEGAEEIGFNRHTLFGLHAILSDGLLADSSQGGRIRSGLIGIHGSGFQPLLAPQLIEECFDQILYTAQAIKNPFEQAFFVMVQLPYLQPFIDVNKRVSRLAANIPLIQLNLRPLSFIDVPQTDYIEGLLGIYEFNDISILRDVFVWAYARSCQAYAVARQALGDPDPFRLHHRTSIFGAIREIIQNGMNQQQGGVHVYQRAETIPSEERGRWIELTFLELAAIHEGNFARFRVRPSEFQAWWEKWNK